MSVTAVAKLSGRCPRHSGSDSPLSQRATKSREKKEERQLVLWSAVEALQAEKKRVSASNLSQKTGIRDKTILNLLKDMPDLTRAIAAYHRQLGDAQIEADKARRKVSRAARAKQKI